MAEPRSSAAPIIAAILLLLPVLYLGSYLALVVPEGRGYVEFPGVVGPVYISLYRIGYSVPAIIFCPVEQIDRKVRPGAWKPIGIGFEYFEGPVSP